MSTNLYVGVTADVVIPVRDHVDMQIEHPSVTNDVKRVNAFNCEDFAFGSLRFRQQK